VDTVDRNGRASYGRFVRVVRRRALAGIAFAAALSAVAGAADVSASNAIRPAPGTPDPRAMVLTSTDLGRAKVTAQRYFKDADFPSVISYEREFEEGKYGVTPLLYVDSQAEVGTGTATTARFLGSLKAFFASKEARRLIAASFEEDIASDVLISNLQIAAPRNLGVGPGSFDVLVTIRVLGLRTDFHIAVFRVERVLSTVSAIGEPGRRVPLSVMTRLAKIMAARMTAELAPRSTELPTVSGTPAVGQTLTATPGTWSGKPTSLAYQWQRCDAAGAACAGIPGATGQTYVVAETDFGSTLRVAVTARNAVGGAVATSAPTSVVSGFVDTFTGDRVSPFWSLTTRGSGPTIVQVNGQLEVTLPAGTSLGSDGFADASALMTCRFPGDFDMQVDYRLLSGLLPTDGINLGFEVTEFNGQSYSGQHGLFVHNAGGNNHGIATNFPDPGVFRPPYNDFVPDTSQSGTLRLVRTTTAGVTRMTAYRLHGVPWSFTSLAYTAPTSQAARLYVFTNRSPFSAPVRVAFDNFKVNGGAIICPP
jgi:hypothetical protein